MASGKVEITSDHNAAGEVIIPLQGTPSKFSAKIEDRFLPRLKKPCRVSLDGNKLVVRALLIPGDKVLWEAA